MGALEENLRARACGARAQALADLADVSVVDELVLLVVVDVSELVAVEVSTEELPERLELVEERLSLR